MDCKPSAQCISLKTGMVITIEPGIYVPSAPQFPKQYHNMGIRIEDEVLISEKDPIVLTVAAPKEVRYGHVSRRYSLRLDVDRGHRGSLSRISWTGAILIYRITISYTPRTSCQREACFRDTTYN